MRRLSAWLLLALLVALGVFSWTSTGVFLLYVGLLIPVVGFHWVFACRRCTNLRCALNAASEEYFLGRPLRSPGVSDRPFSDVRAAVPGLPLVFTVGVGFYGAFRHSLTAFAGCLFLLAAAALTYTRATCAHCTNECPANRNQAYWEWKRNKDA